MDTPTPRSALKTLPRSSPLATQVLLERNQLSRENASLREVLHELTQYTAQLAQWVRQSVGVAPAVRSLSERILQRVESDIAVARVPEFELSCATLLLPRLLVRHTRHIQQTRVASAFFAWRSMCRESLLLDMLVPLVTTEDDADSSRQRLSALSEELSSARTAHARAEAERHAAGREAARQTSQLNDATARLQNAETALLDSERLVEAQRARLAESAAAVAELRCELADARQSLAAAQRHERGAKREMQTQSARCREEETLAAEMRGKFEAARAELEEQRRARDLAEQQMHEAVQAERRASEASKVAWHTAAAETEAALRLEIQTARAAEQRATEAAAAAEQANLALQTRCDRAESARDRHAQEAATSHARERASAAAEADARAAIDAAESARTEALRERDQAASAARTAEHAATVAEMRREQQVREAATLAETVQGQRTAVLSRMQRERDELQQRLEDAEEALALAAEHRTSTCDALVEAATRQLRDELAAARHEALHWRAAAGQMTEKLHQLGEVTSSVAAGELPCFRDMEATVLPTAHSASRSPGSFQGASYAALGADASASIARHTKGTGLVSSPALQEAIAQSVSQTAALRESVSRFLPGGADDGRAASRAVVDDLFANGADAPSPVTSTRTHSRTTQPMAAVASNATSSPVQAQGTERATAAETGQATGAGTASVVVAARERAQARAPPQAQTVALMRAALTSKQASALFPSLSDAELSDVLQLLDPCEVASGTMVIRQGSDGDFFYVVTDGTLEAMIDGKSAGFITSGAVFGEVALLYACARTASVVARSTATLWRMHRDLFRALQAEHAARELDARKAAFASVPSLQALTEAQITSIAAAAQEMHFAPGKRVIARGDAGDRFFVIRSGAALVQGGLAPVVQICTQKDASVDKAETEGESGGADTTSMSTGVSYFDERGTDTSVTLRAGDFFGERALLLNERRSADVYAHPNETQHLVCLALGRRHFEKILGPLRDLQALARARAALASAPLLRQLRLSDQQRDELLHSVTRDSRPRVYDDGDCIVRRGDLGNEFFVVAEGRVDVVMPNEGESDLQAASEEGEGYGTAHVVATLEAGEYFGEGALLWRASSECVPADGDKDSTERRTASIFARGSVTCFVLDQAQFDVLLRGARTRRQLQEQAAARARGAKPSSSGDGAHTPMSPETGATESGQAGGLRRFEVERLHVLGTLASGTFSTVHLVVEKGSSVTATSYAAKRILRTRMRQLGQRKNVQREREVLALLSDFSCAPQPPPEASFVMRLYGTCRDEHALFLITEFVPGGELAALLDGGLLGSACRLPASAARFYTAAAVVALEHLHRHCIVYRDLKPENIMIDADGFPKLIDFGFARVLRPEERSYTVCGTVEYLAPEVVLGRGHCARVDLWSLGVLIFELLMGATPFADEHSDEMQVCRRIVKAKLRLPRRWGASERRAKELLKRLLAREPMKRLGGLKRGFDDIKDHPWFHEDEDFDFSTLVTRACRPPWVPAARTDEDLDVTYFKDWCATDSGQFDVDLGAEADTATNANDDDDEKHEWIDF